MGFDALEKFEKELALFTSAPYAIMTDCCTHAIELCLRYDGIKTCEFTPYTYLSIPMTMHKLGISYTYLEESEQTWIGEYPFVGTRIWDSARRLEPNMYRAGSIQCLSFGHGKPLQVGRGGAILLDDIFAYQAIKMMRYDGRDLSIRPWENQTWFYVGYHYRPTIEEAESASKKLAIYTVNPLTPTLVRYPDCRKITIVGDIDG